MIPTSAPPNPAAIPAQKAPKGAVDCHIHMLSSASEFALWDKRVENPAAGLDMGAFVSRYRDQMQTLGIERTVVVHSILYGADNTVTLEAIERLGRDKTRGIGLLSDCASEAELDRLYDSGIRGIRLNYVHGGVLSWEGAKSLAPALSERGMHLQMLINTDRHLTDLKDEIRSLPVPVVFDHIGWPDIEKGPQEPGFQALCALMAEGKVYTKLSGLYRLSPAEFDATDPFVAVLLQANPERCLWGSDWPYIMLADAQMPNAGQLLDAFHRVVENSTDRQKILVDTPMALYGF